MYFYFYLYSYKLFSITFCMHFISCFLLILKTLTLQSTIEQKLLNCSIMVKIAFIFLSCSFARRLRLTNFIVICVFFFFSLLLHNSFCSFSTFLPYGQMRTDEKKKIAREKFCSVVFSSIIKVLGDTSLAMTGCCSFSEICVEGGFYFSCFFLLFLVFLGK